jgi:mRNA interferase HigB
MKVHLIKKQAVEDYIIYHSPGRISFKNWLIKVKYADWDKPDDIRKTFCSSDLLGSGCNRVVFDIGGNKYRMICKYHFGNGKAHLFICWIGTYADYDELCKTGGQYTFTIY